MHATRIIIIDDMEEIHQNVRAIFQVRKNELLESLNKELFGGKGQGHDFRQKLEQFTFTSAFQGENGYSLIKKAVAAGQPFAVAIVDMRMPPGWDGLQTIHKIRQVDENIEIIICSAYSDYSWQDIAGELGISDKYLFLSKPFEVTEMKQMIINLAEKWWLNTRNKAIVEELRKARETAEASSRAKQEFLSIISHELRTPLNVILMTVEDMLRDQKDQESLALIQNSHRSTIQLAQMVEDIISYTELDQTDFTFQNKNFCISDLSSYCQSKFQSIARNKDIVFTIECSDQAPQTVNGDVRRISSVLYHLLSNAVKYTDRGRIRLDVDIDADFEKPMVFDVVAVRFTLTDSGIGMTSDQLERCFDLFYQGESPRSHGRTGAGMGLSLCRKIANAMGGTLRIESQSGVGSTTILTLPLKLSDRKLS
jgi:signal transduction histidine kinase